MKKEKKNKPSKELPLGFVDRQEKELLTRDFIISNIKEVMIKYGFKYLETPSFEYTDSIGKFLPDKDRPGEGVFSFKDENWIIWAGWADRITFEEIKEKTLEQIVMENNSIKELYLHNNQLENFSKTRDLLFKIISEKKIKMDDTVKISYTTAPLNLCEKLPVTFSNTSGGGNPTGFQWIINNGWNTLFLQERLQFIPFSVIYF